MCMCVCAWEGEHIQTVSDKVFTRNLTQFISVDCFFVEWLQLFPSTLYGKTNQMNNSVISQ